MSRKIRLILLGVLLIGALLALVATLVLNSEAAREEFARQLSQRLGSEVNLAGLELAWLPLPHLLVKGGEFEHPKARIRLGELHLYPRWGSLWQRQIKIGRVILEAPQLFIDPADLNSLPSPPLSSTLFPDLGELMIRRGEITIAAQSGLAGLETPELKLSGIKGRADLASTRLSLELSARPSFGSTLEFEGWYEPGGAHQLRVDGQGLRLHELILSLAHGRVNTLETLANLSLELAGNGPEEFNATLRGDLPCLLLAPAEGRLRLDCGVAHLELSRQQDHWQLGLREFEIKEPGMRLGGLISRRLLPGNDGPEDNPPGDIAPTDNASGSVTNQLTPGNNALVPQMVPHWEIDLVGSDFAVGQIREAVKAVLGRFESARIFYDTVLGGQAESAAFRFSGPESELKNFKAMTVEVEVASAEIMVPEIDLHIDDASGFLRIKDGILEISQGRAVIGNSRGDNGSLAVGLFRSLPIIQLDLDIDADLVDLLAVLPGLIEHPLFQAEAALFHRPEGRATGRLAIGGSKDEFTVLATIETLKGRVESERLPWPIVVESAQALISREEARISELRGRIGPHGIEEAVGWIDLKENPSFQLEKLIGELAAGPLFHHLQQYPRMAEVLAPVLSIVTGRVELRQATAAGRLNQPEQWSYEVLATPRGLNWYSPLLAAEAFSDGGELLVAADRLQLREIDGQLQGDRVILSGELQHQRLNHWQGQLRLIGLMTEAGQQWLKEREWLPPYLLPAYPLIFDPLILHLADGESPVTGLTPPRRPANDHGAREAGRFALTAIAGVMQSGAAAEIAALRFNALLPQAAFSAGDAAVGARSPGRGLVLNAVLTDQENHGEIDLQLGLPPLSEGELPAISLDFSGSFSGKSLGIFFKEPPIKEGFLQGAGKFTLAAGAKAPLFQGRISGHGLLEPTPDPLLPPAPPLAFSLKLTGAGEDEAMILDHLDLHFSEQERLHLSGRLTPDPAVGTWLDLELAAPLLRRSTMSAWRDRLQNDPLLVPEEGRMRWPLLGAIAFQLDELVTGPGPPGLEQAPLIWQPLNGRLDLHPGGGMSATITSAILCCLETTGTWFSEPALGVSSFKISSSCPESSRFEKILPCFGIEQDLISGDCLVDAELHGELDYWQQGKIRISSPGGGRIMRLKLLSRIFSLVNLTDIFSGGIAGLDERGFAYQNLEFEGRIENNILRLERAVVRGEGLNLFAAGTLDLTGYQSDMVLLIAPFKTLDAIVGKIPFIGRALGGPDAAVITIPVGIKGDIREPEIMVLPPEAVGEGMLNLVRNTLMLPFNILSPILPQRSSEP